MNHPRLYPDGTPKPRRRAYDPERHCGAKAMDGQPCTMLKGAGTDHRGAGHCRWHMGNTPNGQKQAAKEAAEAAVRKLGIPISGTAVEALQAALNGARGNYEALALLVREAALETEPDWKAIGVRMSMYGESMDRLARIASAVVGANLGERQMRLNEQQGNLIVEILRRALSRAGIPAEQRSAVEKALGVELREHVATLPEGS